jgi:type VI secretion system protein ImpA
MNFEEKKAADGAAAEIPSEPEPGTVADPLDLESLLLPVSESEPAGEDLRYEGTYDRIREARRSDDPSLPQGVWERGLKKADWEAVWSLAREALTTRTKDVQIAVWYLEASLHLDGFRGVAAGLGLLAGLCRAFWADIHPRPEGDDPEARIAPFVWMNEKLSLDLKRIPVTRPGRDSDAVAYTFADWERAEQWENRAEKDRGLSGDVSTRAKFLGSVMFSPIAFYEAQEAAIDAARSRLRELGNLIDERCGAAGPSFRQFGEVLDGIAELTRNFLEEKREAEGGSDRREAGGKAPAGETESAAEGYGAGEGTAVSIRNRADAYRILSAAADYLLIHEPHSPTPYLVKRAVSWGHMTLTELLHELIQDEHDLNQIFKLLGLQGADAPEAGGRGRKRF